jgi:protein TonB
VLPTHKPGNLTRVFFNRPLRKREKGSAIFPDITKRPLIDFMKLASFLALSAALHAVAFFYPGPFMPHPHEQFIPVTIISLDDSLGGFGRAGEAKTSGISKATAQTLGKKNGAASFYPSATSHLGRFDENAVSAGVEPPRWATQPATAQLGEPVLQPAPVEYPPASDEAGPTGAKVALVSLAGTASAGSAGSGLGGGQGQGSSGAGQGTGAGGGGGFSRSDSRLTQARYRETPKPLYPERARKEGQQGRVLLRVLVDQEGRSKSVQVSGSSGSATLDRAAAEAIKLWRFSPARYGDKPVESWVRIPVDFRLTDVGD